MSRLSKKISEASFGGGVCAKNGAEAGSGGYNNSQYGSNGGDGKVVIVIMYPDES